MFPGGDIETCVGAGIQQGCSHMYAHARNMLSKARHAPNQRHRAESTCLITLWKRNMHSRCTFVSHSDAQSSCHKRCMHAPTRSVGPQGSTPGHSWLRCQNAVEPCPGLLFSNEETNTVSPTLTTACHQLEGKYRTSPGTMLHSSSNILSFPVREG